MGGYSIGCERHRTATRLLCRSVAVLEGGVSVAPEEGKGHEPPSSPWTGTGMPWQAAAPSFAQP